jgi:hypothetical protein
MNRMQCNTQVAWWARRRHLIYHAESIGRLARIGETHPVEYFQRQYHHVQHFADRDSASLALPEGTVQRWDGCQSQVPKEDGGCLCLRNMFAILNVDQCGACPSSR